MKFPLDVAGKFRQILLVLIGNDDCLNTGVDSGQKLFLESANGKNAPVEGDFPRHGHIPFHRDTGQDGDKGGCHGDAG